MQTDITINPIGITKKYVVICTFIFHLSYDDEQPIFDTETFLSNRIHGVFALKLALFCDESHVLSKPLDKRNVMQNVLAIQFSLELRTVCL